MSSYTLGGKCIYERFSELPRITLLQLCTLIFTRPSLAAAWINPQARPSIPRSLSEQVNEVTNIDLSK